MRNIAYLIDNHYISVAKQLNIATLSMNKDRHIISELNSFFAESNNTQAIQGIMNVMSHITLNQRQMDFAKAANCKFTASQVLTLMVLFPFFAVKNCLNFAGSVLCQMFACKELVQFIRSRHIGCHLLGMTKMSKTKYDTADGAMTANAIIARESKRKGHVKYSRHYRLYYCEVAATFAGTPVKLFFYRNGRKGDWNALLATNTALGAYEAYKIYSMRWAIEVSFAEAKRLLNLGKCQCRDFASQIASISLCMLQYNILGYVKRYESYETIGGVFRDVTRAAVELTVTEKIWGILLDVLRTIAEAFNFDQDEMMRAIINNNNKELNAVRRAFEALQLAA